MPAELAMLIVAFLRLLTWVVIARVLASWFVRDPRHPVMRTLGTLTDPFLKPFQKYLTFGMMDFTPLAAILILNGLQRLVLQAVAG